MSTSPAIVDHTAAAPQPREVIYVGGDVSLLTAALAPLGEAIHLITESNITKVLMLAARMKGHAVIIDMTVPDDARTLLVAALAGARHPPRIILIGRRDDVRKLLAHPGVYCVVTYPLLPAQIRAAVADRRAKRRGNEVPKEPPAENVAPQVHGEPASDMSNFKAPEVAEKHARWPGWRLFFLASGRFMSVVSNLYKNAAFVLLASLFTAFCFYGFLIAYFLLSSGWGAPVTLSRGHQMVEKAVNDLSELRVALSINSQRLSEAQLEASKAKSAYDDAAVLADFMKGTIESEIVRRTRDAALARKNASRMAKVLKQFGGKDKSKSDPKVLYKKRLITKKSYDAQVLGSFEGDQRLSMMEGDIETARANADSLESSIELLRSLKVQIETGRAAKSSAGSADLILLTKEVVDARSALEQAASQRASSEGRQKMLGDNATLLNRRIAEIEQGAMGRAIEGRIDVIFVPYGNESRFTPGAALYTCALTVVICHRAGTVGAALPGESTAVHPFFGKPLRGFFVEAKLDDPAAASEEIIHAVRPPFFF